MRTIAKILISFSLIFFTTSCTSCIMTEYIDAWFYGVAEYVDFDEDGVEDLVLNIPSLGYTEISKDVFVNNFSDRVQNENYEIQEGDLIRLWFQKVTDVSIIESYPVKFQKEPDSVQVCKHNVDLENTEDGWLLSIQLTDEIIFLEFQISDLAINDTLYLYYYSISSEEYDYLARVSLFDLTEERMSILIQEAELLDLLYYYAHYNVHISASLLTANENTVNSNTGV